MPSLLKHDPIEQTQPQVTSSDLALALSLQEGASSNPELYPVLLDRYGDALFEIALDILRPHYPEEPEHRMAALGLVSQAYQSAKAQIERLSVRESPIAWLCESLVESYWASTLAKLGWDGFTFEIRSARRGTRAVELSTHRPRYGFFARWVRRRTVLRIAPSLRVHAGLSAREIGAILNLPPEKILGHLEAAAPPDPMGSPRLPRVNLSQGAMPRKSRQLAGNHSDSPSSSTHPNSRTSKLTLEEYDYLRKRVLQSDRQKPRRKPVRYLELAWIGALLTLFFAASLWVPRNVIQIDLVLPTSERNLLASAQNQTTKTIPELSHSELDPPDDDDSGGIPVLIWQTTDNIQGSEKSISAIAFNYSGDLMVTSSMDDRIRIWDLQKNTKRRTINNPGEGMKRMALSPDGGILAVNGDSGKVIVWEFPLGQQRETLTGHNRNITSLSFSPDSAVLAVASGQEVVFWDSWNGTFLFALDHYPDPVHSAAFSADGRLLAVGDSQGTIWIQRAVDGKTLLKFKNHDAAVTQLAFSPIDNVLVSAGLDKKTYLISLDEGADGLISGQILKTLHESAAYWRNSVVEALSFSPDGQFLATALTSGEIHFWETATWTLNQKPLWQPGGAFSIQSLEFSSDSQSLAVGMLSGEVLFLSLEDISEQVHELKDPLFYNRTQSDISVGKVEVTSPSPGFLETPFWSSYDLRGEVELEAGFPVFAPIFSTTDLTPIDLGSIYDRQREAVTSFYQDYAYPGYLAIQITQQALTNPNSIRSDHRINYPSGIGASAMVEPVYLDQDFAEFVTGSWSFFNVDNPTWPVRGGFVLGQELEPVFRWDPDLNWSRLRWLQDDFFFEILAYTRTGRGERFPAEILVQLAMSMFDPNP